MMSLEQFLAAVEAAPDSPLDKREKLELAKLLSAPLFLRACKGLTDQAVNATGAFTKLDLSSPEGVTKAKDHQLQVKSVFFVLETLLMQTTLTEEEQDDRNR